MTFVASLRLILWSSLLSLMATAFPIYSVFRTSLDGSGSAGAPEITVTAPMPGAVLDEETITVAWTASDPDGDVLVFRVEFSSDGGVIWRTVAEDVTASSVEIARSQITASNQARFRVWAFDGVHEVSDTIDGDLVVTDWPPVVEITMPAPRSLFVEGQPITFTGTGYDIDAGPIGGFALSWSSDLNGFLGRGNSLTVPSLALGDHIITLRTPDGQGGYVEDSVLIHIIPADLRLFVPRIFR